MGLFDFFKKKATEEQPQTEEQQEGVLELDGVEVETDAQEADIVLDVEDGQDMNRAVHAVMDEEEIQIDRAGEDILYRGGCRESACGSGNRDYLRGRGRRGNPDGGGCGGGRSSSG